MHCNLFAYVGPDTILPVTSALAAAGGVFLMFGRQIRRLWAWSTGWFRRS
jgi:hypothetical protein